MPSILNPGIADSRKNKSANSATKLSIAVAGIKSLTTQYPILANGQGVDILVRKFAVVDELFAGIFPLAIDLTRVIRQ
jgi:hypothetical protein